MKLNSNIEINNITVSVPYAKNVVLSGGTNKGDTNLIENGLYPNITLQIQQFSTYDKFIYNEELIGFKNGINNIFTIQSLIIPDSEQIISNGFIINKPEDYNISGSTVILNFSPKFEEQLTTNYIKQ